MINFREIINYLQVEPSRHRGKHNPNEMRLINTEELHEVRLLVRRMIEAYLKTITEQSY